MTRVGGTDIVSTPCCGRQYSSSFYSSISSFASEYWTDGQDVASLAPSFPLLHQCACGGVFLDSQTTLVRRIFRKSDPPPPPPPSIFKRLTRWWPLGKEPEPEIETPSAPPPPEEELPPSADYVADEDMPRVIATYRDDRRITIAARTRLWRTLNHPYRVIYRAHRDTGAKDFPPFEPSEEQRQNMAALLALLLEDPKGWEVDISELHRELGDLEAAGKAMAPVSHPSLRADVIRKCIEQGLTGPVRFR